MSKPDREPPVGRSVHSTYSDDWDEPHLAATGSHSAGYIEHDDLGQPRWAWATELEPSREDVDTAKLLKLLDTTSLSIADEPGAAAPPRGKGGGYDPYDTMKIRIGGAKKKR